MKYEKRYKKYKQLLCLFLSFVLLWGILPIEAVFAVEEETVQETEAEQSGEQETDDGASETGETVTKTETETVAYTTYKNSISGMLWVDMYENTANGIRSGDGIRQEGETALSRYTVSLYKVEDKDHAVADITTGADGKYEFTYLEPGSYVVGVASGTINGTEYLLPIIGITGDNKFGTWSGDYARKYSDTIVIGADSIAAGIDAGMRTPPRVQPMGSSENYLLKGIDSVSGEYSMGPFDELSAVASAINNVDSKYADYSEYIVTVMGNDPDVTAFEIKKNGIKVTLTSNESGSPRTLSPYKSIGWEAVITLSGNSELTLINIVLDGASASAITDTDTGATQKYLPAVILVENGTFRMEYGSKVQNFKYTSSGVVSQMGGKFFMEEGSEISHNSLWGNGGAVCQTDGIFTMNGGTIKKNTANDNGGGVYIDGGTFTMCNTSTFNENTATYGYGGGVYLNKGMFTMDNGLVGGIINNYAWGGNGGGVYLNGVDETKSATLEMKAGVISNNQTGNGGGIYLASEYSELNMTGGSISENVSQWGNGGGVCLVEGSFTLADSTISKNEAAGNGIGVYIDNGSFEMQGGLISENIPYGNEPWSNGGGVHIKGGSFTMSGASTISNNKAVYAGGGVCLEADGLFEMTSGEIISNTLQNKWNSGSGGGVYIEESRFTMSGGTIGGNTAQNGGGAYIAGGSNFEMTAGSINSNKALTNGGGININSEIDAQKKIYSPSTFTMSGGTIGGEGSGNTAYDGGGLFIAPGCSFIDTSTTSTVAEISYNKATYAGGGIYVHYENSNVSDMGSFKVQKVKISGNEATGDYGGGIIFLVESINVGILPITMTGGTIEKNTAAFGGGIGLVNDSDKDLSCTIENVTIDTNKTIGYTDKDKIVDDGHGGGVNVIGNPDTNANIELTMKNCKISNNVTSNDNIAGRDNYTLGGGIYCGTNSSLIMTGGSIEKNTAASGGGGAYFSSSTPVKIVLYNVTISKNKGYDGGGLRIDANIDTNETNMSIISGCEIKDNQADNRGGGIFYGGFDASYLGIISIEETKISGNVAKPIWSDTLGIGGGVYITNSNQLIMDGGEISFNKANGEHNNTGVGDNLGGGGGVYVDGNATFSINSGSIDDNEAVNGDGGGIYTVASGTVNAQGTITNTEAGEVSITISGNKATKGDGGGIFTGAAGWNPDNYVNLIVNQYVKFTGNEASASYQPLNAKFLPFSEYWGTITNYTYTTAVDPIYAENNRLVAKQL